MQNTTQEKHCFSELHCFIAVSVTKIACVLVSVFCTVGLTKAPSIHMQWSWPLFCDGTVSILCSLHPALFLFAQPSKCTHLVIPNGGNPRQGLFSALPPCLPLPVTQTLLSVCLSQAQRVEHVKLTSPSTHLPQCGKSFFFFSSPTHRKICYQAFLLVSLLTLFCFALSVSQCLSDTFSSSPLSVSLSHWCLYA